MVALLGSPYWESSSWSELLAVITDVPNDVATVPATGPIPAGSGQAILDSLAAVSASWEALKTSAPDCDQ